ncbi:hypothetical protein Tco_1109700 [Tanacetum coccineum]|uniref:Uncharacterized protein n=1 Tax=Tanacetum coccineum TaxID=301880 RepID=A0ABQ5IGN9_9ASTR
MIVAGADNRPPMLDKLQYEFWKSRMELYIQGTSLSKQERECKLYDEFDKFSHVKVSEQSSTIAGKFVTDVKLARDLHTSNYDQLYAYLEQHEEHDNEARLMLYEVVQKLKKDSWLELQFILTDNFKLNVRISSKEITPQFSFNHLDIPQARGGQLNAAPVLEVENFSNWKKRFLCHIIDDKMNSVINSLTANSTLDDLILYHEGPFDVKESRAMDLKLCYNTFKFKEGESLTQTFTRYKALMNELVNDGIKLSKLEINTGFIKRLPKKWLSFCQSLRNTNHVKDSELASLFGKLKYEENLIDRLSKISPDDEEDIRSIKSIYKLILRMNTKQSLLARSKRSSRKCFKLLIRPMVKMNYRSHRFEAYEWDVRRSVFSIDNELWKVKIFYEKEQRSNLLSKHRNLVHELNTCKKQLLVLKQATLDFLTMHHVDTEILKENKNLRSELKELKEITKTWLNSSNKVNRCISEQIPSQKKKILGVDQLTKDPSSSWQKDLVFVKSLADDTKVTIPRVERLLLSEAEDFILPNHYTSTDYDSTDESLICSTPLPPLKKLEGAEPISGPKTIKSILKSKSTLKAKALKGVIINKPSSAPAKGNKISLASKVHSAPAGDWNSLEYQDTTISIGKKVMNALNFYRMETDEISERYIAPCFVNSLEAFDGEVNLKFDENLILNEFAVKLCLDYEVKKGKKLVKKKLIVALKGQLYFVKFIINPEEDDFEPGVILGRSFLRLAQRVVDFGNGVITIYPELDPFEDDSEKTGKSSDD